MGCKTCSLLGYSIIFCKLEQGVGLESGLLENEHNALNSSFIRLPENSAQINTWQL